MVQDRTRVDITGTPTRQQDDEETQKREGPWSPGIEHELLESRTLLVSGPVTDKMCRTVVGQLLLLEDKDPESPISVYINSPGGSADSGFAMYDMIRFVRCPVRTIVNGLCASAAVLVFLAGDRESRLCLPHSRFLIHQPSTAGQGTASDLRITAQQVLKLRDRYNHIVSEATGKKEAEVLEDASRDFWLDAEEAVDYGLVSRILTRRSEL